MQSALSLKSPLLIFGIPLLLLLTITCITSLAALDATDSSLANALTLDLLLTVPLVYFLLIRTTAIPLTTVVPWILFGMGLGFILIPVEQQGLLNMFKNFALPLIEIGVVAYIGIKVRRTIQKFRTKQDSQTRFDFLDAVHMACKGVLPEKLIRPFASEIAVIYYTFISWKKPTLNTNEFSYHVRSGSQALLGLLLIAIAVETVAIHFLVAIWSPLAAWVLSGLSFYTALQLIGIIKSVSRRPILVNKHEVRLCYGILQEARIDIKAITAVELNSKQPKTEPGKNYVKLSPMGELERHNVILNLNNTHTLFGMYGFRKQADGILLHVDKAAEFSALLNSRIAERENF